MKVISVKLVLLCENLEVLPSNVLPPQYWENGYQEDCE
jgi:hypothetical protein